MLTTTSKIKQKKKNFCLKNKLKFLPIQEDIDGRRNVFISSCKQKKKENREGKRYKEEREKKKKKKGWK